MGNERIFGPIDQIEIKVFCLWLVYVFAREKDDAIVKESSTTILVN